MFTAKTLERAVRVEAGGSAPRWSGSVVVDLWPDETLMLTRTRRFYVTPRGDGVDVAWPRIPPLDAARTLVRWLAGWAAAEKHVEHSNAQSYGYRCAAGKPRWPPAAGSPRRAPFRGPPACRRVRRGQGGVRESRARPPSLECRGGGRADTSDQGVTVSIVLEALQLFVSSVSTTVFPLSAQASRK